MRICVMSQEITTPPPCDLVVLSGKGLGQVEYERELQGESNQLGALVACSKRWGCGVLAPCQTVGRGFRRQSIAVADGKLLGVIDQTHLIDDAPYSVGSGLGLCSVQGQKVGVLVGEDLFFPEDVRALSLCGAVVIVANVEMYDSMPPLLIRAYSYLYGVPMLLTAGRKCFLSSPTGDLATSTQATTLFEVEKGGEYHLVQSRLRGCYKGLDF